MAAFTSIIDGNWNNPATWGSANYPFELSAADTYTVAHSVTTTADNPFAGTGAGVVASGGNLICDHDGSAQNWSGALTVQLGGVLSSNDDTDWKNLMFGGSVTLNAGGNFNWRQYSWLILNGDYDFIRNVTTLINGYFIMQGVADGRAGIKGNGAGNEGSVLINGYNEMDAAGYENIIDYADFQYLRPYSANTGSLYINNLNWSNSQAVRTGNITVSNCTSANYPVYIAYSHIKGMTLNVDAPTATGAAFYNPTSNLVDCSITATAGSGYGIYNTGSVFNSTLSGTSVSSYGVHCLYNELENCTINAVSTSGVALITYVNMTNCTITATTGANYAVYLYYGARLGTGTTWSVYSAGTYITFFVYGGTIDGANLKFDSASWSTANARAIRLRGDYFKSGKVHFDAMPYGIAGSGGGKAKWSRWIHSGTKHFLATNMTGGYPPVIADTGYTNWYLPIVYVSDTTNKYFELIYYSMPGNIDNTDTNNDENFTYTGVLNFTGGYYMLLSAGGTLTFPKYKPWSLTKWSNYGLASLTGGNSDGAFFRLWKDGGVNQLFYGDEYVSDRYVANYFDLTRLAGGYDMAGASVKVANSGNMSYFMAMVHKTGNPNNTIWIDVYNDDGTGKPAGAAIGSSTPMNCSDVATSYGNTWFEFPTPISLVAGNWYLFIINGDWTPSATDYIRAGCTVADINANAYRCQRTTTGSVWSVTTASDYIFALTTDNPAGNTYTFFSCGRQTLLGNITVAGDIKDQIQFKIEDGGGSGNLQINSLYLKNSVYSDINGGTTYVDTVDMEYS